MKALCLARYPDGAPTPGDFALVDLPDPVPAEGEALVQVTHLSLDPMPRTRMQPNPPFGPPMALGAPVEGRGVGRILASGAPGLAPGDWVVGELGWQTRAAVPAARLTRVQGGLPHQHLNALGATGLAAYFVVEALFPRGGDTMMVAPAAGAVGNLVCQMARHIAPAARIVGGVVGPSQAEFLAAQGFEAVDATAQHWPGLDSIDVLVDGVGGAFHDNAIARLNPRARVLLLGFVSGYNAGGPPRYGNAGTILMKRAIMQGFLLADHMDRAAQARTRIGGWLESGVLKPAETIHRGLESAGAAFAALFADAPPGKQIVELED